MFIKFWGTRGSLPIANKNILKYGGNTTCLEVNLDGELLIIDAGTGIFKLGQDIIKRGIKNINMFITHVHWDHIQGFPFFGPIYDKDMNINILEFNHSSGNVQDGLKLQMSSDYFPVNLTNLPSKLTFHRIKEKEHIINNYNIKIVQLNHPNPTFGIRIEKDNESFVFITDNEIFMENPITKRDELVEFCSNATCLIHDTQYTREEYTQKKGWGHSTFNDVMDLANDAKVKNIGFFHYDPMKSDNEIETIENTSKKYCIDRGYNFNILSIKEEISLKVSNNSVQNEASFQTVS